MKINSTGKQIKNFAGLLRGLGMLISILIGLSVYESNPFYGIIIIAVGCYTAWVGTLCLMGFGELIEDTTANRENTDRIIFLLESQCGDTQYEPYDTQPTWVCKKCGTENPLDTTCVTQFCQECGRVAYVYEKK